MSFGNLNLNPLLLRAVHELGFTNPTPIQAQVIPIALDGLDVMGCAQTGSGKTAAFALPILNDMLKEGIRPGLKSLVLVPTRELAAQVEGAFRDCGRHTQVKTAVIIGGVGYHEQRQALSRGAQVLVATPGRMLDHMEQGSVRTETLRHLVLDEADRMLDMGFLPDITAIINRLPRKRQTMLFSATLPFDVQRIASFALHEPRRVEISRPTDVAEGISQVVYPISKIQKMDFLVSLLEATQIRSGLIFCRTRHGADHLAMRLRARNFSIGILHANRTQGQRTAAMEDFRAGKTKLLVATDIAARGIDVRQISHVINFDVPQHPEDYVHRVGRTARAYGVGDAITLMTPEEQTHLAAIEKFTGVTFPRAILPDFPYAYKPQLAAPKPKSLGQMRWRGFHRSFGRTRR